MPETPQQHWPSRERDILVTTSILCVLSTVVPIWRVVYGIKTKRKHMTCDYLLVIAGVLNIVSTANRFKTCKHGLGRHIMDPSISKPNDILTYSYYLWIGQILNILAVALLKYSICAYLLVLNFSHIYLAVIWASILMISVFNLILPMMGCFCTTPFEANWNKSIKGKCFMGNTSGGGGMLYAQGVSNCVSDVVYVVAPLIYLSTMQISRRTQWGLRLVFCLGLVATSFSVVKTVELSALMKTRDPTWDGTSLSIWSATELSVGILTASLPPLRKQFEGLAQKILPSSFLKGRSMPTGQVMPMYVSNPETGNPKGNELQDVRTGENSESQRHILRAQSSKGDVTQTIVREVPGDDRSSV